MQNRIERNNYSLNQTFLNFMENEVAPTTGLSNKDFWQAFTSALDIAAQKTEFTAEDLNEDSLIDKVDSNRWGSLYEALYHENVIPHVAGLKPGNGANHARRDRVIGCAKDFLDRTFPLSEGSHRDAVSYMVYYQNLLVILADGSTTGLKKPRQFVGKNGPTNEPESILLKHNGMHAEIIFERNGKVGEFDLANIDDIQLETAAHPLLDFETENPDEKCVSYRNWIEMLNRTDKAFSATDGQTFIPEYNNWTVKLSVTENACQLVTRSNGEPVCDAVVDALTAAIIHMSSQRRVSCLNICIPKNQFGINNSLIAQMEQVLAESLESTATSQESRTPASIKTLTTAQDSRKQTRNTSPTECAQSPDNAIICAMQCHGYDVTQAMSI